MENLNDKRRKLLGQRIRMERVADALGVKVADLIDF